MGCTLTFNSISGEAPFNIYVSDQFGDNRTYLGQVPSGATYPISFTLPPIFASAPTMLIEVIDSADCSEIIIIVVDPPNTGQPYALLFIEPKSRTTEIYSYLQGQGNTTFFGFGHGAPPLNGPEFITYMKMYATSGVTGLPAVIYQNVPQITAGNDVFGNPKIAFNFETTIVSASTVVEDAWYTWVIPTILTNNQLQTEISYGNQNSPFILNPAIMNEYLDAFQFNYNGTVFYNTFYRVYTTFPSTEFYLNNITSDIYFRGLIIT